MFILQLTNELSKIYIHSFNAIMLYSVYSGQEQKRANVPVLITYNVYIFYTELSVHVVRSI